MPKLVRVRVKSTGALIWVAPHEVNDSVEVLDHQPSRAVGQYAPTPHKNPAPALPDASPSDEGGEPEQKSSGPSSGSFAGKSGTKKEGSK